MKFDLECVVCGHKETRKTLPTGKDNPDCPKCLGPMILKQVGFRAQDALESTFRQDSMPKEDKCQRCFKSLGERWYTCLGCYRPFCLKCWTKRGCSDIDCLRKEYNPIGILRVDLMENQYRILSKSILHRYLLQISLVNNSISLSVLPIPIKPACCFVP